MGEKEAIISFALSFSWCRSWSKF